MAEIIRARRIVIDAGASGCAVDLVAGACEIVADPKGFAVPHPAIAIERVAQDEIRKWGSAFRSIRRPKPKADAGTGWQ